MALLCMLQSFFLEVGLWIWLLLTKSTVNIQIRETQRVIDITRALKKYFPVTECPMIVANIGGFTMDELLPTDQLDSYYERFADSLVSVRYGRC